MPPVQRAAHCSYWPLWLTTCCMSLPHRSMGGPCCMAKWCSAQCCVGHTALNILPHLPNSLGTTAHTALGTSVHVASPPHWVPLCTDGLCAGLGGGQGRTFMQCLPVAHHLIFHLAPACCMLGGGQERALIQRLPVAHRLTSPPRSCLLHDVRRAGRWSRLRPATPFLMAMRSCTCSSGKEAGGGGARHKP